MTAALPRLFVDHPFPDLYRSLVDGRFEVVGPDDADLLTADAVLAGARRAWNAEAFSAGPTLKVISRIGIGYDNVDVPAATAAGVIVCNAPDAPTVSTAEHAVMLMMAITKHLPAHMDRARQGLPGAPTSETLELDGATLGLVGVGRIGRRMAVAGLALGMRVFAVDPSVGELAGCRMTTLDDVIAHADVLSLHAPALPETRHMLNAATLAATKRGVYIVNCARGALIDQDALLDALNTGQVAAAGLDVTDPEPLPADHPLLAHPNVIITPHVASSTAAGRHRLYQHAIANVAAVLEGRPASVVRA